MKQTYTVSRSFYTFFFFFSGEWEDSIQQQLCLITVDEIQDVVET